MPNSNLRKCGRADCPHLFPPKGARKYCSKECSREAWAGQVMSAKLPVPVDKKCEICGATFKTTRPKQKKYCTLACAQSGLARAVERQLERRNAAKLKS